MPIYEYHCEKCDCQFEQLLSPNNKKAIICPKCGSKHVKKQFSCFASTGISNAGGCKSGGTKGFS